MSDDLTIQSHKGPYTVHFRQDALEALDAGVPESAHFIIDRRLAELYADKMPRVLEHRSVLLIEAAEENKSLERMPGYVDHLVGHGVKRGHDLIAIGGGITQDITCFMAAVLLRGLDWWFYPTTLLAQADSCIGSKSSINAAGAKNIVGTFTPPRRVFISTRFLHTLDEGHMRSGVGEMLKVHAIAGPEAFDRIAADYQRLFSDPAIMADYIRRSLEVKKTYIEEDEFDRGPRNVFNYGHSFGHAIEAATDFAIPHGIAVTIGMDMANFLAARIGVSTEEHFHRMHPLLKDNYRGYESHAVPLNRFLQAISRDKKNVGPESVTLILPDREGRVFKDAYPNDGTFAEQCAAYLEGARAQ